MLRRRKLWAGRAGVNGDCPENDPLARFCDILFQKYAWRVISTVKRQRDAGDLFDDGVDGQRMDVGAMAPGRRWAARRRPYRSPAPRNAPCNPSCGCPAPSSPDRRKAGPRPRHLDMVRMIWCPGSRFQRGVEEAVDKAQPVIQHVGQQTATSWVASARQVGGAIFDDAGADRRFPSIMAANSKISISAMPPSAWRSSR